jgi:hypothetical protein
MATATVKSTIKATVMVMSVMVSVLRMIYMMVMMFVTVSIDRVIHVGVVIDASLPAPLLPCCCHKTYANQYNKNDDNDHPHRSRLLR